MAITEITRIRPHSPDDFDEFTQKVATRTKNGPDDLPFHHYAVYAHNAWFLERWMQMAGTVVMRSSLNEREKLLTIMRVAYRLRCSFAWIQRQADKGASFDIPSLHGRPQDAGLSEEEILLIAGPPEKGDWSEQDLLIMRSVDETWDQGGISSPTWTGLVKAHSQEQMYDLVVLIGYYLMTCSSINSMGVQNYPGDPVCPWDQIDNGSPP